MLTRAVKNIVAYVNHIAQDAKGKARRIRTSWLSHELAGSKSLHGFSYICAGGKMEVASYSHVDQVQLIFREKRKHDCSYTNYRQACLKEAEESRRLVIPDTVIYEHHAQ
jgi:hypothetical protein